MPPASINDLPVELHTSILKHLLSLSRNSCVPADLPCPDEFEWTEKDTRSTSLFPFNVFSVSQLWRDLLVLIPECWTRVVFDVAKDPKALLAAFVWSGNLENIEVFVFNSEDIQIVNKSCEGPYSLAIAQALYPHIHRCKSIVFDVTYTTSLPSSTMFFDHEAPYLTKLSLGCQIENICPPSSQAQINWQKKFATSFPKLRELSLTGFFFMYLVLHARQSDWLDQLSRQCSMSLLLSISNFTFPRHGSYSLPEFLSYFTGKDTYRSIDLRHLSLAYSYEGSETKPYFLFEIESNCNFHSVSKDFLAHFYAIAEVCEYDVLSFEACEIPELKEVDQIGGSLYLTNMIDDDEGTSLRHIFEVWEGHEITICSCPSFNDKLLSWLTYNRKRPQLSSLTIIDCDNFSSRALRELVCLPNVGSMDDLHVSGRGPVLFDEDKKSFEKNKEKTAVYWAVCNDQGNQEVFSVGGQYGVI